MDKNKREFRLLKKTQSAFSAIADGFSVVTTFLFRIKDRILFNFVMKLSTKANTSINLKKIRLNFIQVKLKESLFPSFNLKKIRLSYVLKERLKAVTSILLKNRIVFGVSLRQKAIASIGIKKINITFSPLVREFIKLSTHDPQTLATLDLKKVGEMDYNGWTP